MDYWRFSSIPELKGKDAESIREIRKLVGKRAIWKFALIVGVLGMLTSMVHRSLEAYVHEFGFFATIVTFIAWVTILLPVMNHIYRADILEMELDKDVGA